MKDPKIYEAFCFQECQNLHDLFTCASLFREHWKTLCPSKRCPVSEEVIDRMLAPMNEAIEKMELEHGFALKAVLEAQFKAEGVPDPKIEVYNVRTGEVAKPVPEEDEIDEEYHKYFGIPKADIN